MFKVIFITFYDMKHDYEILQKCYDVTNMFIMIHENAHANVMHKDYI